MKFLLSMMLKNNFNNIKIKFNVVAIVFASFVFFESCFFWSNIVLYKVFALIFLILSFFLNKRVSLKKIDLVFFSLVVLLYCYFPRINQPNDLFIFNSTYIICLIYFCDEEIIQKSYILFCKILSIILLIGIFEFVMFYLNLYTPTDIVVAPDNREYFWGVFNLIPKDFLFSILLVYRYSSIFNEPGLLGTISILVLTSFKFDFKNNKFLFVYLISGIITFSLAFYALLLIGLLFYGGRWKLKVSFIILFMCLLFVPVVNDLIISRVTSDNVDNRNSKAFIEEYREFSSSWGFHRLFGNGNQANSQEKFLDDNTGSDSLQTFIYNFGLLGLFFCVTLYVYIIYRYGDIKMSYVFILVFFMSSYQRQSFLNFGYLFIFLGTLINNKRPIFGVN